MRMITNHGLALHLALVSAALPTADWPIPALPFSCSLRSLPVDLASRCVPLGDPHTAREHDMDVAQSSVSGYSCGG